MDHVFQSEFPTTSRSFNDPGRTKHMEQAFVQSQLAESLEISGPSAIYAGTENDFVSGLQDETNYIDLASQTKENISQNHVSLQIDLSDAPVQKRLRRDPALQELIENNSQTRVPNKDPLEYDQIPEPEKTHLDKILDKYPEGKIIRISYKQNRNFMKESTRNILVHLIIKSELDKALATLPADGSQPLKEFKIWTLTFETIAKDIEKLFPSEDADTYFTCFKKLQGQRILANGKLWVHYNYTKQNLRDQGVLSREKRPQNFETTAEKQSIGLTISEDIVEKLQWLKTNDQPVHTLLDVWRETFEARREILMKEKKSVSEYFNLFLGLRMQGGISLIECDFATLHQQKTTNFLHNWEKIRGHLIFRLTNATNIKDVNDKAFVKLLPTLGAIQQDSVIFYLLPYIIPSERGRKDKESSNSKKPLKKLTLTERRDSFTLRVETAADIKPRLQQIREDLRKSGEHLQPTVVLVGGVLDTKACYVVVDDIEYKVASYIHSLDLVFKIFYSVHCEYPERSRSLWLFVQKGIYAIEDPKDKFPRAVISLSKEITYILNDNCSGAKSQLL